MTSWLLILNGSSGAAVNIPQLAPRGRSRCGDACCLATRLHLLFNANDGDRNPIDPRIAKTTRQVLVGLAGLGVQNGR